MVDGQLAHSLAHAPTRAGPQWSDSIMESVQSYDSVCSKLAELRRMTKDLREEKKKCENNICSFISQSGQPTLECGPCVFRYKNYRRKEALTLDKIRENLRNFLKLSDHGRPSEIIERMATEAAVYIWQNRDVSEVQVVQRRASRNSAAGG